MAIEGTTRHDARRESKLGVWIGAFVLEIGFARSGWF